MKIIDISIRQFLGLESLDLHLQAPINVIIGENEAGKSSIRDAIQWYFTGQARGLKTHEQQSALIRDGGKAAEITLTLADGSVITRRKTPKSPATATGTEDLYPTIWPGLLCDTFAFLEWPEAQRRELLFQVIPGLTPKGEDIFRRIQEAIPDLDQGSTIPHDLVGIAVSKGFKAAETEAVTGRRVAKRLRDEATVDEPDPRATIGGVPRILPDILQADVQSGLDALRAERDKLLRKRGKAEAQTDKLPKLEQELAALVSNPVDPPEEGAVERWEKALQVNAEILAQIREKISTLQHGAPGVLFPEACPACMVPCPSAGETALPPVEPSDPAEAERLKADLQEQEKEVGLIENDLKVAQTKQAVYDDYCKQRQDIADRIAKLKAHQEQAQATAGIDEQIAALDARMKTGYELLDAVRDFWRKKETSDAAQAKVAQAEEEIILYDALAKALAPDGIPSQMIAEALGPVNDLLDVASVHLFPGRDLALTEGLGIELSGSPFTTLSKSAKFRVGVAFQYVLAKLAGARLLMVDEADILDPSNRGALIDFLLEIQPDFDTILVFATSQEAQPSPVPEIQIWWIEAGRISPVEVDGATHEQAAG